MPLSSSARRLSLWTERLLMLAGAGALLYCAVVVVEAHGATRDAALIAADPATHELEATPSAVEILEKPGLVVGRIEIAKLGITAAIIGGIGDWDLKRGVGHVPGTAMPGGLGTMGLAGHRDTFFRALQDVKPQMEIRVAAADGQYRYIVDSTEVVTPEQVDVIATRERPGLSLITCFPFHYIGAAPKRFIVHAHLVSAAGE
jgi:sortase A